MCPICVLINSLTSTMTWIKTVRERQGNIPSKSQYWIYYANILILFEREKDKHVIKYQIKLSTLEVIKISFLVLKTNHQMSHRIIKFWKGSLLYYMPIRGLLRLLYEYLCKFTILAEFWTLSVKMVFILVCYFTFWGKQKLSHSHLKHVLKSIM